MSPQSDFILDNQTGAQFRADLNNALEAMAGFSSGSTAPTTTYAYQYWADTTNNVLKQRDGSNAGWIVRGKLTTDYGQAGQVLTSAGSDEAPIWTSISEDNAWTVAQDATNAHYTVTGNGFDGTETNPDIYLTRGSVYNFTNASATQGFQIQSTAGQGGTAYSDGITSNNVTDGTLVWTVQMDAPTQLYYQSTSDSAPGGNIYVLDESGGGGATIINGLNDVDTSTVPPTDGQALVWDNTAGQWEPGTVAGGGGATTIDGLTDVDTTTVAPTDGQALVWDNSNSQWEPGNVASNIEWNLTANGTTDYIFAGPGFAGTETDPTIYVVRGQTYKFTNAMGAHPFQIQSTQGTSGTVYNNGITNNGVSNGTLAWEVRMDAPSILYYQCTSHALMAGTIYVLDEGSGGGATTIDGLTDVDTTSVAPTNGQVLVWDNTAGQWEPGSIPPGGATTIDALNDVDTSTVAPTDGQALVWDNANSQWEPGTVAGSNAVDSVNSQTGVVVLDADDIDDTSTTNKFATAAQLTNADNAVQPTDSVSTLNDVNTSGVSNGDVLSYNGTSWVPTSAPPANISSSSIDALNDVDTSTVTPTDGQALVWDNTASQWEPGTVASSSSIQTATDFDLNPAGSQRTWIYTASSDSNPASGVISNWTGTAWMVNITDNNGDDASAMQSASGTLGITAYVDGVLTYTGTTVSGGWANQNGTRAGFQFTDDSWKSSLTGGEEITLDMAILATGDTPLADGDILQWVDVDSKFKPVQLPATVSSIDDLSDVDTSTVAPTDGQALVWDNAASQWEPGTVASSSSIQTATDFELQPAAGTASITRTGASQTSNVTSGNLGLGIQNSGYTYWSTNPDGLAGTVLDYLVNTATFPIDVDISGTTYTLTGAVDDSASGTPNVELAHDVATSFSNAVSYTLSLASAPTLALQNNDILQWVDADSAFKPVPAVSSIDDLSDVDTSTVAPTDGQALVWDNANSQWEPGTVASSIQTATDFELQPATGTTPITRTGASQSSNVASGNVGLSIQSSGFTYWSVDPEGDESGTILDYLSNVATFPIDVDISGTTYTITAVSDDSADPTNPNVRLDHTAGVSFSNGVSYTLSLAAAPTLPLQNNDILQWVNADSKFKPVQQTGSSIRTLLGIGEYVDDTAAGTGGVASGALYYNTTTSDYKAKT